MGEPREMAAQAWAPGKAILFGEHAVVYARPAIAVPVNQVQAEATVREGPPASGISIRARDLGWSHVLGRPLPPEGLLPLAVAVESTLDHLRVGRGQDLEVVVQSSIPIARGLGSGAAVAVALIRALAGHFQRELSPSEVSELAYEVEKLHHGTPSGIDNTVVAYGVPVYFRRGEAPVFLSVGAPLTLVIADSGVPSSTKLVVALVRQAWIQERERFEALFDAIGGVVERARAALLRGRVRDLASLMDENQELLRSIGVSSPEVESLVEAAKRAGAWGAKLSGAGYGGNVIALVAEGEAERVRAELLRAEAAGVIITRVE